jgi:hypothetical protein
VAAPIETLWAILMDSTKYGEWSDLRRPIITPPGPTRPGQVLESKTSAVGLTFRARLVVRDVDAERHRVAFDVDLLPLGIHNAASIIATRLDARTTRVAYG